MVTDAKNQPTQQWEKKWLDKNQGLTPLGKLMLKAKQKALRQALGTLNISTAIDVGCGLGHTLAVFKNLGIEALGIDVSPAAVKICKSHGLNAEQKKIEDVNEKYDLVFSDGLLEHFLNFELYVQKMCGVSNRYVIITQTDHASFLGKTSIYLAEILRGSKNVLEYNYRIGDFIFAFGKYGFRPILLKKIFCGIFQLIIFKEIKN